jgi:hypothetical protein
LLVAVMSVDRFEVMVQCGYQVQAIRATQIHTGRERDERLYC